MIRAILIDTYNDRVSEVRLRPDLGDYYEHLKCDVITSGLRFQNGDVLFVDDMGLLKRPKHFFRLAGVDYDFAGNGLIVGTDDFGETIDAKTDVRSLAIEFQHLVPFPAGRG